MLALLYRPILTPPPTPTPPTQNELDKQLRALREQAKSLESQRTAFAPELESHRAAFAATEAEHRELVQRVDALYGKMVRG